MVDGGSELGPAFRLLRANERLGHTSVVVVGSRAGRSGTMASCPAQKICVSDARHSFRRRLRFFCLRVENYKDADEPPSRGEGAGRETVRAPLGTPSSNSWSENAEEREGPYTVGSPATDLISGRADTAVSIEREVVSGHAYAIPAPETDSSGRCGINRPTCQSVNGVF